MAAASGAVALHVTPHVIFEDEGDSFSIDTCGIPLVVVGFVFV